MMKILTSGGVQTAEELNFRNVVLNMVKELW